MLKLNLAGPKKSYKPQNWAGDKPIKYLLFSGDANTTSCVIGLLMSLFGDDLKVLMSFLRMFSIFAQRVYLSRDVKPFFQLLI